MKSLFSPRAAGTSGQTSSYEVELDSREPFLDDHRPGGAPLLGTVMSIEVLASAVSLHTCGNPVSRIGDIVVRAPLIIHDESRTELAEIRVETGYDVAMPSFRCALLSGARGSAGVVHMQATVGGSAGPEPEARSRLLPRQWPQHPWVSGRSVYERFFHGPSFQVIGSAQWQQDRILCRLKKGLPPSHLAGHSSYMSPRLIEFGLQSAGLLELASSGRMMIPSFIGSIERVMAVDVDVAAPLFAVACLTSRHGGIDIEITDAAGCVVMLINDYRTTPLPFSVDRIGLAELIAALRRPI